jgi:NAD(P)-dependent dehydrogenase (short-subunit alcohol dehydrogenase family)
VAFRNAGVSSTSVGLGGPAWDLAACRHAFGINVDGVFFGVNAALPALRARGRGALVLTSEVAGALLAILASDRTGEAWYVQPGRPAEPFAFRNLPGPHGSRIGGVPGMP